MLQTSDPVRRADRSGSSGRPHTALIVGAVVVGLVITGECVAITLQTAPRPALSSAALRPVLPSGNESAPALVWTNGRPGATGGPIDLTRGKPVIVGACEGGGSIEIRISPTATITLDCSDPATAGPIVLDDRRAGTGIDVEVSDGNPRYIVELVAVAN